MAHEERSLPQSIPLSFESERKLRAVSSGRVFGSSVNGLKESGSCLVKSLGGFVVADAQGQAVESFEGDSWLEGALGLLCVAAILVSRRAS